MAEIIPFPFPYERRLEELLQAYRDAQFEIANQLALAATQQRAATAMERRRQLAAVLATLERLGRATDPLARNVLRNAWAETIEFTDRQAREAAAAAGLHLDFNLNSLGGVNEQAVRLMEDSILDRLQQARRTVGRQVYDIYGRLQRRAVMMGLLGADGSPRAMSERLVTDLRERGITSFVDAARRQWKLETYADMATRTVTREAVAEAAVMRMAEHNISVAEVSRSKKPCAVCRPWEGQLISLDGRTRELDGQAVATMDAMPNGGPPFHPRCAHFLMPTVRALQVLKRETQAA